VTTETSAGQDGLYILIEIEASPSVCSVATDSAHRDNYNDQTKTEACRLAGMTNRLLGTITAGCGM
jgi:allantoicase